MSAGLQTLAPAKINLGLFVGPRRADGRHLLVTVMQPITLADRLVAQPLDRQPPDLVAIPGAQLGGDELCARALAAFRARWAADRPAISLAVEKRIPIAAGLGGGSADAGAALRLACELFGCEPAGRELVELAAGLGADVPAQVCPARYLAQGVGEQLEPLAEPRGEVGVVVAALPFGLSTGEVYARADRLGIGRGLAELAELAAALRGLGADHVFPSGSGPTVVGLFAGPAGLVRAQQAAELLPSASPVEPAGVWSARFAPPSFARVQPLGPPGAAAAKPGAGRMGAPG